MIEPLRLDFTLACPPAHAFRIWTEATTTWWPPGHTQTGEKGFTVVFEPFEGGRIFERTPGGEEIDWGEIVAWEPPHRLAYLWHIRADRADATDVEISFREEPGGCRVEIVHSGWERLGARGLERRDANGRGWSGLLPHFAAACG